VNERKLEPVPQPEQCEIPLFGGGKCIVPAYYDVSYGGGDSTPMCLPHIIHGMEEARADPGYQQQEWVITYL
jgi:hypothetical protein